MGSEREGPSAKAVLDAWLAEHGMSYADLPLMLAEDPSSAELLVRAGMDAVAAAARREALEEAATACERYSKRQAGARLFSMELAGKACAALIRALQSADKEEA